MFDTSTQFTPVTGDADASANAAHGLMTLTADTKVLTLKGERRAGDLAAGDRIITRDSGAVTLRAIVDSEASFAAVFVTAGTLGQSRPETDTRLPPDTLLHLRDWRGPAMGKAPEADVAAERLLDIAFAAAEPVARHSVVTLAFDRDHIIYADGLELRAARG